MSHLDSSQRKAPQPSPDAQTTASHAHLRYTSDQKPGYHRKRCGQHFRFIDSEGKTVSREESKRIRALVIPPAWEQVWICPHADGHLQATGRDVKSRKQYIYHPQWHEVRKKTKFNRLAEFGRLLPKIRRHVARDLRLHGLPREKVIAAVVWLLEETNIRIGNPEYAEKNDSFGLSTMRNRHVSVHGPRVEFRFRGKSGKFHEIDLTNMRLARIVKSCQELSGHDLFEYLDHDGNIHHVTSGDVNDYLRAIVGEEFSAKDFRTWAGTVCASQILRHSLERDHKKPSESALVVAIDRVARALGNTRSVCRKYYIHPAVIDAYLKGTLAKQLTNLTLPHSGSGLTTHETAVLELITKAQN